MLKSAQGLQRTVGAEVIVVLANVKRELLGFHGRETLGFGMSSST